MISITGISQIIKIVIVSEPTSSIENKKITILDKKPKIINKMPCFTCFVSVLFDTPFCFLFWMIPIINPAIDPYMVNGIKSPKNGNMNNGNSNRFKIEVRVHLEVNDIPRQLGNINIIKKYLITSIKSPISAPFCHGLKLRKIFLIEKFIF